MLTYADVIEALTGNRPEAASLMISEAAIDSRQVIPAGMFVALPGEHVDGHDYVPQAFERGAHLALVQKDIRYNIPVIDLHDRIASPQMTIPNPPFCLKVEDTRRRAENSCILAAQTQHPVIGITGSVGKSTTRN